jgi:alkanesulfonate monooxygenase SsuD/methylene tetrahydromethanopterin reductase-like flavin-dependent oxidoreductase (luciferase family)
VIHNTHVGHGLGQPFAALDRLWTSNPVEHKGTRWSILKSWVDLKPVQAPVASR